MFVPAFYRPFTVTPEGQRLAAIAYAHEMGFIECSLAGIPAVAAMVPHLAR